MSSEQAFRRNGLLAGLERIVRGTTLAGLALILPIALLLFLQWPLRDVVHAYSREANDLAQILFALYVSAAITFATRRGAHLAADALAHRYSVTVRRLLERAAALLVALPWSAFVLYAAWAGLIASVAQREAFSETLNPGYFLIRAAAALLALLVFLQGVLDVVRPLRGDR